MVCDRRVPTSCNALWSTHAHGVEGEEEEEKGEWQGHDV